ncbi:ParB/RepB/Spo0J family partition protein [Acrocarpospora sp. B8E8]|uniref:ParB/RepB/Spo0J family partition protein n=1 Tax=Acrocarpospora sp. B8E8 TaxID=3153572 RepID=UPI00325DD9B6
MQTTANPLDLQIHNGHGFAPRHEVYDPAKRDQLAADMTANGWQGPPVVADVDTAQAITGSHRIPAARLADIAIPVVDIADLAEACGIDLWEFVADHGTLEDALPAFCAALPADVRDAYGLDID